METAPLSSEPAAAPTVELGPIDISAYRGNTGIDYVTTFDSGRSGPHATVVALTHGNEVCGAHALAFVLENGLRPAWGRLSLCFANVAAYQAFDAAEPTASRFLDEDFNRVWGREALESAGKSQELERARALRPLVDEVDYLLDLHSMLQPGPALTLCGMTARGRTMARALGYPGYVVADAGHAGGTRLRDYGFFAEPGSKKTALLVECGQHWRRDSAEVAIETTVRFLLHLGLVEPQTAKRYLPAAAPPHQRLIEVSEAVTVANDHFAFARGFDCFEVVAKAGTAIAEDGGEPVRTPYDDCVLVMPSTSLGKGQTAVRFGRLVAP
jgi:predicted deacylase